MAKIIGVNGFNRLMLGRETNINQVLTKPFQVNTAAVDGILPGDLLIRTEVTQSYITPVATGVAGSYEGKVAGIALATNVKTDVMFPQSEDEVRFKVNEAGACVVYGEVAVKLHGVAPAEGAEVFYDISERAFATTGDFKINGWTFSGITEGDLTVVYVK